MTGLEIEKVTIEVPKSLIPFIRFRAEIAKRTIEQQLHFSIVDEVRAELEAMHASEFIEMTDMKQAFDAVLGEE